jgi:hypothetical protein
MATLISIMRWLGLVGTGLRCRQAALATVKVLGCLFVIEGMLAIPAHATCGDWLAHAPAPQNASAPASPETAGDQSAPQPTPSPAPCSGPSCGQIPWAPTPATPVQLQTVVDQFAALSCGTESEGAERCFSHIASDVAPNAGFSRRIEHPPRA